MDGIILMAPMIKIADSAKPHPLVVEALKYGTGRREEGGWREGGEFDVELQSLLLLIYVSRGLAYFFPTWAIVPSVDVVDLAFRQEVSAHLISLYFSSLSSFASSSPSPSLPSPPLPSPPLSSLLPLPSPSFVRGY